MTAPDHTTNERAFAGTDAQGAAIAAFLRGVYWWMFVGLGVTALVATIVAGSPTLVSALFGSRIAFFGLIIVELGLVMYLSARVASMAPGTASALFLVYAGLNGITFAAVLLAYTGASVASTFMITAGMFGGMALYGTATKRDLSAVGRFMFMGLIGLVIASVVGIFWHNSMMQFVMGIVGVVVFAGLTAYDSQRLREMALQVPADRAGSYAIVGALSLYLNFINLFLSLLRIFGNSRD